jgi:hypothetical protein
MGTGEQVEVQIGEATKYIVEQFEGGLQS